MAHSPLRRGTVAQAMLRCHQIDTGRRLMGIALGLSFLVLGGGALARASSQGVEFRSVQGWVSK